MVRTKVITVAEVSRCSFAGSAHTSRVVASTTPGSADVPITGDDVLGGGHLGQPHRAAGVQLLGGDADLGPEAELTAIGEARGRVDEYGGRVDLGHEPP